MCRNIHVLHNFEPAATPEEIEAAALQYVRKISGATKPSKANEVAFERAVEDVTAASARLLATLVTARRRATVRSRRPRRERALQRATPRAAASLSFRSWPIRWSSSSASRAASSSAD